MNAGTETVSRMDDWDRHWDDYASSAERNPAQRFRRKLILSLLGDASQPPERGLASAWLQSDRHAAGWTDVAFRQTCRPPETLPPRRIAEPSRTGRLSC